MREPTLPRSPNARRSPGLLRCEHLDVAYDGVQVLFDVSLSVGEGEFVALLGANGVGKTTLLDALSGRLTPSRGTIALHDEDVTRVGPDGRVVRGLTQVVGQDAYGALTVDENLRMFSYAGGKRRGALRKELDLVLDVFPRLQSRRQQLASTLSGGERQMLALSRALVQDPDVLLVDELSLGLAPIVVGGLAELLRRLHERGTAILVVEQAAPVALDLAQYVYVLQHGSIVAEGPTGDFEGDPDRLHRLLLGGES